jgi:hypothetical protein
MFVAPSAQPMNGSSPNIIPSPIPAMMPPNFNAYIAHNPNQAMPMGFMGQIIMMPQIGMRPQFVVNMPMAQNFQPQIFIPQQIQKTDKPSAESAPQEQSVLQQTPPAEEIKKQETIEAKVREPLVVELTSQQIRIPPDPAITMINKQEVNIAVEVPVKLPTSPAKQPEPVVEAQNTPPPEPEQNQTNDNQNNKENPNDNSKQNDEDQK